MDESVDFDKTQNLFITGDNLEALKLLQESYLNKVDMIYIDPPYNTGHDFIYHDNFHRSQSDEIDDSRDDDGNRQYAVNSRENGRYHSDWLSMMYPRLMIARNLLSDRGAIFVSIDDTELCNLKLLLDEVFGVSNFVGILVWKKKTAAKGVPPVNMVVNNHEYVLCYQKSKLVMRGLERDDTQFSNPDDDPRGPWKADNMKSTVSSNYFEITMPGTGWKFLKNWAFSADTIEEMINDDRIIWPRTAEGTPRQKRFKKDYTNETIPITTMIGEWQTETATNKLKQLFSGSKVFDNPKPNGLIRFLVDQASKSDSIVLDFFAGSGTTADAVMQLNAEDGGHRKFIMVQLPEECSEKSEAYKAGYKTIDQLSRERIRRAAKKIKESDKNADDHDYGFRALYIDKANAKDDISVPADSLQQNQLSFQVDDIYADRSPLDLLFGVLVAKGWQLDGEIEQRSVNGNDVYLYDYVPGAGMVACFDNELTDEAVNQVIDMHPQVAVFRETAFKQSDEKINLMERFKNDSSETRVWVI